MALRTKQVTVGTSVVSVLEPQVNQTRVFLHNAEKSGNEFIWIGGSNAVTTSTGYHIDPTETIEFVLDVGNQLWAITDKAGKKLHVLWQVL